MDSVLSFFLIFCIFFILFDLAAGQRRTAWYPKYPIFAKRSKTAVFFLFSWKPLGFSTLSSEIYTSKEISSQHNISFGCFSSAGFLKILQIVYCNYFDSCDLVKVSLNDPEKPFDHPGYSYQLKDGDSMDLKWCQRTDDCYKSCGNFPPCLQARRACCKL